MQLQDEIAKKEEVIKELQQENVKLSKEVSEEEIPHITEEETKISLLEDSKIINVIESYIDAVEIKDFYKELNNVKVSIDWVLFSIFDDTVDVRYTIENNNNFKISTSAIYTQNIKF